MMIQTRTAIGPRAPGRAKVLLIDDDPLFGSLFQRRAALRGVEVRYFESLLDAVYGGDLAGYDAAVVDCLLEGADGFELSDYFRIFFGKLPVVLISSAASAGARFAADTHGAKAFVRKSQGVEAILGTALPELGRRVP